MKSDDPGLRAEIGIPLKQLKARLARDLAADPDVPAAAKRGRPSAGSKVADRHLNTLSSESAERIVRRLKRRSPRLSLVASSSQPAPPIYRIESTDAVSDPEAPIADPEQNCSKTPILEQFPTPTTSAVSAPGPA